MKAQIPPSTATLTDSASNSVMAFPIDFVVAGARGIVLRKILLMGGVSLVSH
jgi:hypothetical protein